MINLERIKKTFAAALLCCFTFSVNASVIDAGDLTIIDDVGNPSDGLRFLDMSFSNGLSLSAALTNAQLTYNNARAATDTEFNDLFTAAGVVYSGALTASDAFAVGSSVDLTSASDMGVSMLNTLLGNTSGTDTNIFTAPDGSTSIFTTRDFLQLQGATGTAIANQNSLTPPSGPIGFLLVSEATVPEPATVVLLGIALIGLRFNKRKKA